MCKNNKYEEVESLDNSLQQSLLSSDAKGNAVENYIEDLSEYLSKRDYKLKLNESNLKLVAKTALKYNAPIDFILNKAVELFLKDNDELFIRHMLFAKQEETLRKILSSGKFSYEGIDYSYFTYSLSTGGVRDVEVIFYDKEHNILDITEVDLLDF